MLLSAHFILAIVAASSQADVTDGDYEISSMTRDRLAPGGVVLNRRWNGGGS